MRLTSTPQDDGIAGVHITGIQPKNTQTSFAKKRPNDHNKLISWLEVDPSVISLLKQVNIEHQHSKNEFSGQLSSQDISK